MFVRAIDRYLEFFKNVNSKTLFIGTFHYDGLMTTHALFEIYDIHTLEMFFNKFNVTHISVEKVIFPALIKLATSETAEVEVSVQYEQNIVNELIETYEDRLKARADGIYIVEILEGDEEGFCVDLGKLAHIGGIINSDKIWGYSFFLIYPGSEKLRPEFRSKEKAMKARNELITLFKRM